MKFNRQFIYTFLLISIFSGIFVVSCSSDDDPVISVDSDEVPATPEDPVDPAPPTVTAPVNLNGIWEGTMTDKTTAIIYDVDMVFSGHKHMFKHEVFDGVDHLQAVLPQARQVAADLLQKRIGNRAVPVRVQPHVATHQRPARRRFF